MGNYVITDKTPLELSVEYAGDRKLEVPEKLRLYLLLRVTDVWKM